MEQIITYITAVAALYLVAGLLFSLVFLWKGLKKTDAATRGSGILFKFLIVPGMMIFWPLFVRKWINVNTT